MKHHRRFAALPATFASLALVATPVAAAEFPDAGVPAPAISTAHGVWSIDGETYDRHRRYRHRRDRGISAGDVLAGVLIIGGIAAVASAASNADRNDREVRNRRYRGADYPYRERRGDSRYAASDSGLDRAVSMCVREIERDVRIETVDNVSRTGAGWSVSGRLYDGSGFTCRIDNNGRIDAVDYGTGSGGYSDVDDRQYGDDRYRSAWAEIDAERGEDPVPRAPAPTYRERAEQMPAYPGGPIDGDLDEDQIGDGYQGRGG